MRERPLWKERIQQAWKEAPIVWLSGVRRSGKTTLARSLAEPGKMLYVNCDLPVMEDRLRDPELFFRSCERPIVVFDEVHRLSDPSRVLKIGADGFPKLKILATGSSTLSASRKFRDTLTGRKRLVHLLPVLWSELAAFSCKDVSRRLLHGGLPQALLADAKQASFYREWLDSFFARDIQRLFAVRDMDKFNALFEYLLKQSGGQVESSRAASALGISRVTVEHHLQALEITHAVTRIRPFFGGGQKEILKMPKAYGFDTGFITFVRGWDPLRMQDHGILWEHLVLESLQACAPNDTIRYWRDKAGREVDFVLVKRRDHVDAVECKWNPSEFDPSGLKVFRSYYPKGDNYLVSPVTGDAYLKRFGSLTVRICDPSGVR
ncbi:MAG: ATP-binding protein [Candidatus Omnitrophica bacterium]|nr:ATP-binding protein [Candidatus Omnitrophota bacterium]MBI3021063.1 ATP-binding protein [Candidatus Omnitrophota bacterium]MBI3083763.1 ATP-binding protein [Candidatus Omnitrophota bacterium]